MPALDVAVTGIGLVTPAGNDRKTVYEQLLAKKPFYGDDPVLSEQLGFSVQAGRVVDDSIEVPLQKRDLRRASRFAHFAIAATAQALNEVGELSGDQPTFGVYCGTTFGGGAMGEQEISRLTPSGRIGAVSPFLAAQVIANASAGMVASHFGLTGPNLTLSTACAAGTHALGEAARSVAAGYCSRAVAFGGEAMVTPFTAAAFARAGALNVSTGLDQPFDEARAGFILSEGCVAMILESGELARARGIPIHGYIDGYGATADGYHMTDPDPTGDGARRAMALALAEAQLESSEVGWVNAHGTGTRANDLAEAKAISGLFGTPVEVTSNKGSTGHMLGGSGAFETAMTFEALCREEIPPVANLSEIDQQINGMEISPSSTTRRCATSYALTNSFAIGGQNASLLLRRSP